MRTPLHNSWEERFDANNESKAQKKRARLHIRQMSYETPCQSDSKKEQEKAHRKNKKPHHHGKSFRKPKLHHAQEAVEPRDAQKMGEQQREVFQVFSLAQKCLCHNKMHLSRKQKWFQLAMNSIKLYWLNKIQMEDSELTTSIHTGPE